MLQDKDSSDDAASLQQGMKMNMNMNVVYSKDNVAIHPSQLERISGRLRLIKHHHQSSLLLLSWIPYKDSSNERDRDLYTIKDVSLTDVRSIRRQTPTLGWQYIILLLSSGLALPALYFYNGGVREFLATLKHHIFLARSADDANVFLVNDFRDPLQRSLSSLELPRVITIANSSSMATNSVPSNKDASVIDGSSYGDTSGTAQYSEKQRQKVHHDAARDLSIHVLEKFSLVTRFARKKTTQIIREINGDGFGIKEKKSKVQSIEVNVQEAKPSDEPNASDEIAATSDPEVDELSLVWGKPRQPPLRSEEWETFLDTDGRVVDLKGLKKRIFYGGVDPKLRNEVWKFLLGYHEYDSTYAEREDLYSLKKAEYHTIKSQWQRISPAQEKRFAKFRERKGIIDKDVVRTDRSVPFYQEDDSPSLSLLRDILLTYSFYNFDLGYCQGMNDLLSPILYVIKDEVESFWCFVALMERLGPNFDRDQNGMHSQLFALLKLVELLDSPLHKYFEENDCLNYFFCFRWILIQFKREFSYQETMRLWEVLWTHHLSEHFHLYVCVALLRRYRRKIMEEEMEFDTLLKFINELSGHIQLDPLLRDAESLCIIAGENGEACIPPGTPPSIITPTSHHDNI